MAKFSVFYTGAHTHTQLAISSLDSTVTCFTHFSPWVNLLLGLQLQRHVVLSKSLSNYYIQTYINFLLKLHQLFSIITCGLDCEKDAWLQMFCNCPQELKKNATDSLLKCFEELLGQISKERRLLSCNSCSQTKSDTPRDGIFQLHECIFQTPYRSLQTLLVKLTQMYIPIQHLTPSQTQTLEPTKRSTSARSGLSLSSENL